MFARLKRALFQRPTPVDPFAIVRAQIIGTQPVTSGIDAVDLFLNLDMRQLPGVAALRDRSVDPATVDDPVLQGLAALNDADLGRAAVFMLMWSRKRELGARYTSDNRTDAFERIAKGRGIWAEAEAVCLLTAHADLASVYNLHVFQHHLTRSFAQGMPEQVVAALIEFLDHLPLCETRPGSFFFDAIDGLSALAGVDPEDLPVIRDIRQAEADIAGRQAALFQASGSIMQMALDRTAPQAGAVTPLPEFKQALAERLEQASPEDRAQFLLDLHRCQDAAQDRIWKLVHGQQGAPDGINPTRLHGIWTGVVDRDAIARRKLAFTHVQATEMLRLLLPEHGVRSPRVGIKSHLAKSLARGITEPDAALASDVRNANWPQKIAEPVLAQLCPTLCAKPAGEPDAPPLQRELEFARDQLRGKLARLPGLWVRVPVDGANDWTQVDHQLYPFFSEIRAYVAATTKATRLGFDTQEHRANLTRLHQRGIENLLALQSGQGNPAPLDHIRQGLPDGEEVAIKSIYWTMRDPEEDRDVFDATGRPKAGLIARIEARFLDGFAQDVMKMAALDPATDLGAKIAGLLPQGKASKPSKTWLKQAREALDQAALGEILQTLAGVTPDGGQHFAVIVEQIAHGQTAPDRGPYDDIQIQTMIWAAPLAPAAEVAPVLRDLAVRCYKRMPGIGPVNLKLGNAAVLGLARLSGVEGVQAIAYIMNTVAFAGVRKTLEKALTQMAEARGLTRDALEELALFDHGLVPGPLRLNIGPGAAVIRIDTGKPQLAWEDATGVLRKSVPKALSEADAEGVKLARARLKTIQQDLSTQKARLERMYRREVSWPCDVWLATYANHGTMAVLARRLLWCASNGAENGAENGDDMQVVLPCEGGYEDISGQRVDITDRDIRLWHPMDSDPELCTAWRARLMDKGIVQPFRQVWRETYALTAAELETGTYSNRFAGHVVRQHQLMALGTANGWTSTHRVNFDTPDDQPTHIRLPDFGVQAEYWTAPAGLDGPLTPGGSYLYLVTDRLQLHQLDESARFGRGAPVALGDVHPRLVSELLRDCDLFTSVASISLDPEWQDKGQEAEHPTKWRRDADAYWNWSHEAELPGSAQTRKAMLAVLLPRLKSGAQLSLDDRYLKVQGKLHSYRIHLGSAAVQRADTTRHICIVPDRVGTRRTALPFDGDATLAAILSKALLLVDDDQITDSTILGQISD